MWRSLPRGPPAQVARLSLTGPHGLHTGPHWAWETLDMLKSGIRSAGVAVREK